VSKQFSKNDQVTYITNWDRKGTFMFQHAVVYSCGNKQMVLTDAINGKEMGRHYSPEIGEAEGTFPRMTDDEAIAHCLKHAEVFIPQHIAYYERLIERNRENRFSDKGYRDNIRKDIDRMHEAQAHHHQDHRPA